MTVVMCPARSPARTGFTDAVRTLLAGVAMLLSMAGWPALGAEFTPEQRDQIVQIVRDALRQDPGILREAAAAIQSDQAKREADAARAAIAANHAAIYDPADPFAGNRQGSVTVVEFYDPRCPYCRQLEPLMATWLEHEPDARLIYKDIPILGPPSVLGSRALLAAQRQGGYARLRDAIMSGPPNLTDASIRDDAQRLGLDWARMQRDMLDPAIQQRLDNNVRLAKLLGIEGTPAFVVGEQLVVGSEMAELQAAVASLRARRQ